MCASKKLLDAVVARSDTRLPVCRAIYSPTLVIG